MASWPIHSTAWSKDEIGHNFRYDAKPGELVAGDRVYQYQFTFTAADVTAQPFKLNIDYRSADVQDWVTLAWRCLNLHTQHGTSVDSATTNYPCFSAFNSLA